MGKRKRMMLVWLCFCLAVLPGCQKIPSEPEGDKPVNETAEEEKEQPPQEPAEEETDAVVWRIVDPFSTETEMEELISVWQKRLNVLLEKKDAGYSVEIKAAFTPETPVESEELDDNYAGIPEGLEALKKEGVHTDLVSLPTEYIPEDISHYCQFYLESARKGLLLSLEPLLESAKGQALREAIPEEDIQGAQVDGAAYGLSVILPAFKAVAYSKEKMAQYGIDQAEIQASLFDNEELFQRVKELSGETPYAKWLGWNVKTLVNELGIWNSMTACYMALDKEGKFVNVVETQEFRDYLTHLADWKEKGLVEFLGTSKGGKDVYFAEDTPDYLYSDQVHDGEASVFLANKEQEERDTLLIPDPNRVDVEPYWGDQKLCIASWTKKQEQAEDLLVRIMTDPDIANLIQYGREDKDYILEDSAPKALPNANFLLRLTGDTYTNPLITYSTAIMDPDKTAFARRFHDTYGQEIPYGFRFDPSSVAEQVTKTNQVFGDGYQDFGGSRGAEKIAKLDLAAADVDGIIAELTEKLKEAGIDDVLEEANRQLEKWKKENL